jgi:hypothetical protein
MAYLSKEEIIAISQAADRPDAEQVALKIYFRRQEAARPGKYEEVTAGIRQETDELIEILF